MKLVIVDSDGNEHRGVLVSKDSSFLFMKMDGSEEIKVWSWDALPEGSLFRVTPNGRTPVNMRME